MVYIFVDVEARGTSPVNGTMTEFGAVVYDSKGKHHKETFHGVIYLGEPDPENPAVPVVGMKINEEESIAKYFTVWLNEVSPGQAVMVSDNPAYDFMWIAGMFDIAYMDNPFGHSARRISDFYAGLTGKFSNTQRWKRYRKTPHDHNPVNDAMGNVEAFETILRLHEEGKL